ncbi:MULTISPECIES: WD40/YVTN/BNR-like repeat-containing protein [Maribacter]|uniref:Glycosyl hydrolase n=1 Tax=Maribacter flavus TaxID=1658664 RepID=A0ABU7IJ36_9FLAO|nr:MULTISPECIES: glycosyl hydrolase [Maribacter]MDC6405631.1 glycosyl hydrolase [Maribacter sp. PR66]MEE1972601.1 glycosyl hydrolase [Maribacter flavus]
MKRALCNFLSLITVFYCLHGQRKQSSTPKLTEKLYESMTYRNIGPFRGGRSTTVTGIPDDIFTYYMGATGGGVWKTTDGGTTWNNISDGFFNTTGIGDITVAPSDPNIIYVGTGESPVRGVKTSHGDGLYKSTDAGKTWKHMGLEKTRHISDVYVHPTNPNKVYVAAQGNPWGPNPERGVYLSEDGGTTWEKILFVNEDSGIVDMTVDVTNPDIMMVASWDFHRKPWVVHSGGPGSRIYKTTDGGKNWKEITKGLPELKGKMGVAISPADPNIVYIAIDALGDKAGVYRSEDGGESFVQTTNDATTYARSWYYMHIIADPKDADEVWVMNSFAMKSIDGGKTFEGNPGSHVDHHDLWINPHNSDIMINANDGGASVTYNGGKTWSTLYNQPTGQFYRVITDNGYPYRVYSGQQDNSTIAIDSRVMDDGIGEMHWDVMRAGESSTVAVDPNNPRYVYSTYFASNFVEWDRDIDNTRMVMPYPTRVTGEQPKNLKYRANWNGPVIVSPHNPSVIYYGSQYVMKSTDRGVTWKVMSEDLTRNDKEHQGKGGEPISNEQITAESYNNLFNIEESPLVEGVIWVGSDDGLVHLTRDGGETWTNVTPKGLKESIINVVEPSPHDPATAYIAVTGYKLNDFTPYIFKTNDYGATWEKIVNGIPGDTFARTVREDPDRRGLLYAGTETGIFVSFDDGANWMPLQNNLPEVPITDLRVQRKDLVVATQGRALWILDDLTPLHQISETVAQADSYLYDPRDVFTELSVAYSTDGGYGENPPSGVQIHYVLNKEVPKETPMSLEILDKNGTVLHSESTNRTPVGCDTLIKPQLKKKAGAHRYQWNMKIGRFDCLTELYTTNRDLTAYNAPPGAYTVRLKVGDKVHHQEFNIDIDPRLKNSIPNVEEAYMERDAISKSIYTGAKEMAKGVRDVRLVQEQLNLLMEMTKNEAVKQEGKELDSRIETWIEAILQKEMRTYQSNYMFEARLLIKFKDFLNSIDKGNLPMTPGVRDVSADYLAQWAALKTRLSDIRQKEVPEMNTKLEQAGLPELYWPKP